MTNLDAGNGHSIFCIIKFLRYLWSRFLACSLVFRIAQVILSAAATLKRNEADRIFRFENTVNREGYRFTSIYFMLLFDVF